ncbi:hypothetical protein GCM10023199_40570 [Actinomycetospora chibensis]
MRVVHAHDPDFAEPTGDDDAGERAESYLQRTAPDLGVRRTCTEEDPATALAAACGPETVLVLGDRHRRLASEAGRTTEELIAIAPCPVLVVAENRASSPAGTSPRAVVVGVDDAPGALQVLLRALRVAEELGEPVEVVRAVGEVGYGAEGIARREQDEIETSPVEALIATPKDKVLRCAGGGRGRRGPARAAAAGTVRRRRPRGRRAPRPHCRGPRGHRFYDALPAPRRTLPCPRAGPGAHHER